MKVRSVVFSKQVGKGGSYQNEMASVTVELKDGDSPTVAVQFAKKQVYQGLGLAYNALKPVRRCNSCCNENHYVDDLPF